MVNKALVVCALLVGACGFDPPNGHLTCATQGKPCPDGFECVDAHCWKPGTAPMQSPDLATMLKQNGDACTDNGECTSAICSDSVCCDRDCSGTCEACNVDPNKGTCTFISGTPISPRMPCGHTGSCLGTCDGTKSGCNFPSASTICGGACDGTCDGAGNCSSSGGVCPAGFSCGVGACKTSCTGPTDCQPNWQCNTTTSMCERVPESDCLDGLDNNGDGLIDCADPTCSALVQCVADVGAGQDVGIVLDSGPCPTGYDSALPYTGQIQGKACNGCTCATKCQALVHESDSSVCATDAGQFAQIIGNVGGGAVCVNYSGSYAHSYNWADLSVVGCAPGGSASQAAPTWGVNKVYCLAHRSMSCTAGQICVAKTPSQPACARVGNVPSCPTGYTTGTNAVYYTGYSAGGCGACGCGAGNGTCGFAIFTNQILNKTCGTSGASGALIGIGTANCGGANPGPSQAAAEAAFTMSPSDNCTTSSTNTPPSPTGDTRFCCQ